MVFADVLTGEQIYNETGFWKINGLLRRYGEKSVHRIAKLCFEICDDVNNLGEIWESYFNMSERGILNRNFWELFLVSIYVGKPFALPNSRVNIFVIYIPQSSSLGYKIWKHALCLTILQNHISWMNINVIYMCGKYLYFSLMWYFFFL